MCWPDFYVAEEIIEMFKDKYLEVPSIDIPEKIFKEVCYRRWAADDLLNYLYENWYETEPCEIIADYIDDCRYRAEKYFDQAMGSVYETAKQTAENILIFFAGGENEYSIDS